MYAENNPIMMIDVNGKKTNNAMDIPIGSYEVLNAIDRFYDSLADPQTYTKCQALEKVVKYEEDYGKDGLLKLGSPYHFLSFSSALIALNNIPMQSYYGDIDLDWTIRLAMSGLGSDRLLADGVYRLGKLAWTVARWGVFLVTKRESIWRFTNQQELNGLLFLDVWMNSNLTLKDLLKDECQRCGIK